MTGIIFEWLARIVGFECFHNSPSKIRLVFKLTFPYHEHVPAKRSQCCCVPPVAGDVGVEFAQPELTSGLWHDRIEAFFVSMPEAAVDENHSLEPRKGEVRLAWQIRPPERETETESVHDGPYLQLGTGIPALNSAHIPTSMLGCNSVRHRSPEQAKVAFVFPDSTFAAGY